MKKLPIGIQTFEEIIKQNYLYIDKTELALELIENYKYSFLSRPRRFGKSLFLDTLHNIFEGKKELFKGLDIYEKWDWEENYPVIKISWAGSDYETLETSKKKAKYILEVNQERLKIECEIDDEPSVCFARLITEAYKKYNKKVVILIDEYDKPILNNIENTKKALKHRNFLRGFYEVLKDNDAYIKFAFLTGISKFSKANIFSGLNNLEDISLTKRFGNVCGYTQKDIENDFREYWGDTDLEKVKRWYNGYSFMGDKVYNPFNILKFIKNEFAFENYWWESGNPSFLITLLKEQKKYNIPNLENITVGKELLNSFEIEKLKLEVLLFQAGYLTIERAIQTPIGTKYKLKIPNMEVQISLNALFLEYLLEDDFNDKRVELYEILFEAELEDFRDIFVSLFASLANNNYTRNDISKYEGYYASVFYAYLSASGLDIIAEDVTNIGRIDLTIKLNNNVYIIEFKIVGESAIQQIKRKEYADKYRNKKRDIYLIGIEFNQEKRNISKFEWEKIDG